MVAGRMAVYSESSKQAEYATVEHAPASFTCPLAEYFSLLVPILGTTVCRRVLHRVRTHTYTRPHTDLLA